MTGLRRLVSIIGAAAFVIVASPLSAHATADPISINLGSGWVHDSAAPLLSNARISPGWSTDKTLEVRNNTDASATIGISSADIVDLENGCMHSEAPIDSTCGTGPDQGELGHEMIFSVYVDPTDSGAYPSTPTWTGTLYDIQAQPAVLSSSMPANSTWGLKIAAALPHSSGNETQTDSVGYTLRLDADGAGSAHFTTTVLGETFTKTGDPNGGSGLHVSSVLAETFSRSTLPFTGLDIGTILPIGVGILVVGDLLLLIGSLRRRRAD